MPSKRVEVLTFDGCLNATAARALVNRVVADLDVEAEVASVRVLDVTRRSASASSALRRFGSTAPMSSRVRATAPNALACRVYATASDPSNVPAEGWLRAALSESS